VPNNKGNSESKNEVRHYDPDQNNLAKGKIVLHLVFAR